jgi:hypothetical protein
MKIAFAIISLLILSQANASLPNLQSAYSFAISKARSTIISSGALNPAYNTKCHQQIYDIAADKQIDILLAFGYMDVSGGQDFKDSGAKLYGNGNTLDIDARNALENTLMTECLTLNVNHQNVTNSACGFRKAGGKLTKTIRDRFTNKNIRVTVQLVAPSVSSIDSQNQTSSKQKNQSDQVRSQFLSGLQTKDVVVYLGHARSGGGPDFYPPVLLSNGHVNYSYYKQKQEGIRSMLGALKQANEPASVVAVLACKSTGLFAGSIKKYTPHSTVITAGELFDYNDILPTGYAIVEAIVGQNCGEGFNRIVKANPSSARFLNIYN